MDKGKDNFHTELTFNPNVEVNFLQGRSVPIGVFLFIAITFSYNTHSTENIMLLLLNCAMGWQSVKKQTKKTTSV